MIRGYTLAGDHQAELVESAEGAQISAAEAESLKVAPITSRSSR